MKKSTTNQRKERRIVHSVHGLQRCRWQYVSRPIFIHLAVVASKICETQRDSFKIRTDGSSRSSIKKLRINNKDHRDLSIGGQAIENVENFSYLGAGVSTEGGDDEDVHERLRNAQVAFRRLSRSWNSSVHSTTTKVRLFNSLVKAVLLHGCEIWKMTEENKKTLDT